MKSIYAVLLGGVMTLIAGIVLQLNAENWSLVQFDPPQTQNGKEIYTVDSDKDNAFEHTSIVLDVLGVILVSIGAFRLTR